MPIAINGSGTLTGVSVGGLPDGIVDTDMLANNAVTAAKATGVGFTPEVDGYRINANYVGSADPITQNWERFDSTWEGTGYSGASLITASTGVWTFAKTGWYYFYLQHTSEVPGGVSNGFNQFFAYVSTNSGSNWTNFCESQGWFGDNVSTKYMVKSSAALIKVADVSTYRLKVSNSAGSGSLTNKGSSTKLQTGFILLRIGDA